MKNKAFRISDKPLEDIGQTDEVIICLPYFFRDLLLSAAYPLLWDRSYGRLLTEEEKTAIEEGIQKLSEEECDMQITVSPVINIENCGGGSGGGSGGCSSPPPWEGQPGQCYPVEEPPNQSELPTLPPLPPEGVPPEEWDSYRCKLANYAWELVDAWLLRVSTASTLLGTLAFILFFLWSILPATLAVFVGGALLELAGSIVAWSAYLEALDELFERSLQWWRDNRERIVCEFYNATNAESLRETIVGDLLTAVIAGLEERPDWFSQMADMVTRTTRYLLPLRLFTMPWTLVPPTGYVGAIDCTCDGETGGDLPIAIDGEWWLIPIPQSSVGGSGSVSLVPNDDTASANYLVPTWTQHPLTTESFHEIDITVDSASGLISEMQSTYGDAVGGTILSLHGHLFEFLTTYTNGMDGVQFSSATGGAAGFQANAGQRYVSFDSQFMDGGASPDSTYQAFVDGADLSLSYGNSAMTAGKMSWRMQSYNSTAPGFVSHKLWYMARVETS